MENSTTNPLSKYFRQPAIYLQLPSKGRYWPDGSLDMPITGDLPVYPMTTKDEIILRTPDALLNGNGVVDVIQSCVPNIKDAWQTPSLDVDAILIAIRIATYGNNMPIETACPHCQAKNDNELDLQAALASIRAPAYNDIDVGNLKVKLRPQPFFGANRDNAAEFAEQKLRQALELPDTDPKIKAAELAASIERLIDVTIDAITDSTEHIVLPDGTLVTDKAFIKEFYQNAERSFINGIQEEAIKINKEGGIPPNKVACADCTKEYEVPIIFDYSRFFGAGS